MYSVCKAKSALRVVCRDEGCEVSYRIMQTNITMYCKPFRFLYVHLQHGFEFENSLQLFIKALRAVKFLRFPDAFRSAVLFNYTALKSDIRVEYLRLKDRSVRFLPYN